MPVVESKFLKDVMKLQKNTAIVTNKVHLSRQLTPKSSSAVYFLSFFSKHYMVRKGEKRYPKAPDAVSLGV